MENMENDDIGRMILEGEITRKKLLNKAIEIYIESGRATGGSLIQPSEDDSWVDWENNKIYLENINGVLAVFHFHGLNIREKK